MARSVDGVNRVRRKINRDVGRFVIRNGGLVVRHPEEEDDGVHLAKWVLTCGCWACRMAYRGPLGCGGSHNCRGFTVVRCGGCLSFCRRRKYLVKDGSGLVGGMGPDIWAFSKRRLS